MRISPEGIAEMQRKLGLSDTKMAKCLGVTRQTWRNWKTGRPCPQFAQNALTWLMELRRVAPANDNIPERMRFLGAVVVGAGLMVRALVALDLQVL